MDRQEYIEYAKKEIKSTEGIIPHVVSVNVKEDELGRKVFEYANVREYDKVRGFRAVNFRDGVAEYKGEWKGFLVQCKSGKVVINYSSDVNERLVGGIEISEGDAFGVTDVELRKVRIEQGEGGSAIISFIGE